MVNINELYFYRGEQRKRKERAGEHVILDNIEEELAAFDSDAQETQLMESTGAAMDDEMNELSPITKIGRGGGRMLFPAK